MSSVASMVLLVVVPVLMFDISFLVWIGMYLSVDVFLLDTDINNFLISVCEIF